MFTEEGKLIKVRSIRQMLEDEAWDADLVERLKTSRWKAQWVESEVQLEEREGEDSDKEEMAREAIPRDFPIKKEYLEKFGYTEASGRCRAIQTGRTPTQHHTNKCRQRIRDNLEKTESKKVQEAQTRKDEYIARQVEASAEGGRSALYGGDGVPGSSGPSAGVAAEVAAAQAPVDFKD